MRLLFLSLAALVLLGGNAMAQQCRNCQPAYPPGGVIIPAAATPFNPQSPNQGIIWPNQEKAGTCECCYGGCTCTADFRRLDCLCEPCCQCYKTRPSRVQQYGGVQVGTTIYPATLVIGGVTFRHAGGDNYVQAGLTVTPVPSVGSCPGGTCYRR